MNGKGLDLLKVDPQLIVGLVIGSIFGILFMRGIPVGPFDGRRNHGFFAPAFEMAFLNTVKKIATGLIFH